MIPEITELNFPSYATLSFATATIADMGEGTIAANVKIDGAVVPDFSFDWAVMFKGSKYIQPLRTPQGAKDNTSLSASIDLTFQHWAIYQLKRYYFVELTSIQGGTAIADKYIASVSLNLADFVTLLNNNLSYYFGNQISAQLNPDWVYATESTPISISYSYLWDVIQQLYELFAVRWAIEPTDTTGTSYVIKIGYDATELSHAFQYGHEGGLLRFERQVQSTDIRNELLGRGGDTNLPKYYFKTAPDGSEYASDPDANEELANITFTELRGKTFRDYVKGWNNAHHAGAAMATPTWAYTCGKTDATFNPIEYVKDNDSIAKYGVLIGGIDNQEDIFPSIQGAPNDLDKVVAVEEVTSDDVYDTAEANSVVSNVGGASRTTRISASSSATFSAVGSKFSVPNGQIGVLTGIENFFVAKELMTRWELISKESVSIINAAIKVYSSDTGNEVSFSNLPAGAYWYEYTGTIINNNNFRVRVTTSYESVKLTTAEEDTDAWKPTFDIWIKNIWNTTKGATETAQEYADRVWIPILNEGSKVSFSSGALSISEDYEFTVYRYAYNEDANIDAEWVLTLVKSDAEAETSGIWIPSVAYQASAGDGFYFTGIDMPQQYVEWAEERLDSFKTDELNKISDIQPTYSVELDSVRIGTKQGTDASAIIDQLETGAQIILNDSRFLPTNTQLYITNITYTWDTVSDASAGLTPTVQITLSNEIVVAKNPISRLSGEVSALQKQVGSISNIEQIVRAVGDKLYLRKDGFADKSYSETQFVSKITGGNFREGIVGGADWGITRDADGNSVAEFDIIKARKELQVNNLVVNQVTAIGGKEILSAASIMCTNVIETTDDYVCYFDQHNGTIANLFEIGDVAMSQVFDASNTETKFYKRKVVAVDVNSITLSKTTVNGTGMPSEGDVIIQYGNYTNTNRQYVIIRDVIGGGYERMLSGLSSVNTNGTEYYFVGRMGSSTPRWYVGDARGYIEYQNGILRVSGSVISNAVIASSLLTGKIQVVNSGNVPIAGMSGQGGNMPLIWAGTPTDDMVTWYAWTSDDDVTVYTLTDTPATFDLIYENIGDTTEYGEIDDVGEGYIGSNPVSYYRDIANDGYTGISATEARYRTYDDGRQVMGINGGRRIEITPLGDSPEIALFDSENTKSLFISGDNYQDGQLFGGTVSTYSPSSTDESLICNSSNANSLVSVSKTNLTITTTAVGKLTTTVAISLLLHGEYTKGSGISRALTGRIYLTLNGLIVFTTQLNVELGDSEFITIPLSFSLGVGQFTIATVWELSVPNIATGLVVLHGGTSFTNTQFTANFRANRYFANGNAIGYDATNYAETLIENVSGHNNKLLVKAESGSSGFMLRNNLLQMKLNDTWYTVSRDSGGFLKLG